MIRPEILFLKQEDVIASGVLNMGKTLELVEKVFYLYGEGEVKNPPKTETPIPDSENWTSFFNSMPVYIGGEINKAGIKWAAESLANINTHRLPLGIDIVILSDPNTVLPLAIMDGTLITAMRTAASAGVAAKYLARKDSKIVCCVGAGVIGRTMIMALKIALPSLKEIRLFDLNFEKAQNLATEFNNEINVLATKDLESATKGADIIVTMTTSRKPFLKSEWVKSNALVIQMNLFEIEKDIIKRANKIVLDNWAQLKKNPLSVFHKMYNNKELLEDEISEMKDIVFGSKPRRESENELIVFGSHGLGCLDIIIADYIYKQAKEKEIGQKLVLWNNPKWI